MTLHVKLVKGNSRIDVPFVVKNFGFVFGLSCGSIYLGFYDIVSHYLCIELAYISFGN